MPPKDISASIVCRTCGKRFRDRPSARRRYCSRDCYAAALPAIRSTQEGDPLVRFWSKVDRSGGPDACWPWTGDKGGWGYGRIMIDRHRHLAHRLSWEIANGPIPSALDCLHTCDNPICVNPAHLFLGTDADNVADKMAKGRHNGPYGESVGTAKLTAEQVAEIRRRYLPRKVTHEHLATEFGVTKSCIGRIVQGKGWRHV